MSTEANAPPHRVTVVGDPTIADGPTVLNEMERDAAARPIGVTTAPSAGNVAALVLMIVWIVTGILILTRQPGNRAGWVFLAIGVAWLASALAVALVTWDVRTRPGAIPLRASLALGGRGRGRAPHPDPAALHPVPRRTPSLPSLALGRVVPRGRRSTGDRGHADQSRAAEQLRHRRRLLREPCRPRSVRPCGPRHDRARQHRGPRRRDRLGLRRAEPIQAIDRRGASAAPLARDGRDDRLNDHGAGDRSDDRDAERPLGVRLALRHDPRAARGDRRRRDPGRLSDPRSSATGYGTWTS